MKNFYSEVDDVTLTYSDIKTTDDGMEYIRIYFEKPIEGGFSFLESVIPGLDIKETEGFSDEEVTDLLGYANRNAFIIWRLAKEGSAGIA
ncbi:hypothetical protein [Selenomonas ruminantium]|uniref:Uncharacterized protein n=1 Tax=Selenomonas ruminantium TaxID=971 RepID=A0A1I0XKW7_SELRU|nr:hypothetical protein [Selenomonas ruminantium]SFB01769.1 hypothetical protein SAMN05216587_106105 [Selenomonas ruminantium]